MYQTKISNFLLACAMVAGFVGVSGAQDLPLTILETHEAQCVVADTTLTNWSASCDIPLYDPANHSGSILDSVMVTLIGTAMSTVDVTSTTEVTLNPDSLPPSASLPAGVAGATVTADWTVGGSSLTLSAFPESPIVATQNVIIPANTPTTLADLSGTDDAMLTTSGAANTAIYVGTGTFAVDLSAMGYGQQPFASGGNLSQSQSTNAGAQLIVQYKTFEPLPEPNAGLMAAFGFAGILGIRRRRGN